MEPFLSVYGHVAIDQICTVRKFPRDNTTEDVLTKTTVLGGTGPNIAVHAARLGVPTALCAFVGNDFPANFEKYISDSGLIMDEFVRVDGYDTSQCTLVTDPDNVLKALFYQGPQGCASQLGIRLVKNASKSKFTHFCTGEPVYYIDLMKDIPEKISLDPAQEIHRIWNPELLTEAMKDTDFLFGNNFEFESILKYLKVGSIEDIDLPLVVCTCGEDGSEAVIDGERFHIPTVKAEKVVDAVGAGDSYRAGFYAGLYHGYDIHESLVIASSMSSFVVEQVGAMTADPGWEAVMERADPYLREI